MLRKVIFGSICIAFGYILGSIIGFTNGVQYQEDKSHTQQNEQVFKPKHKTAYINLELESQK